MVDKSIYMDLYVYVCGVCVGGWVVVPTPISGTIKIYTGDTEKLASKVYKNAPLILGNLWKDLHKIRRPQFLII